MANEELFSERAELYAKSRPSYAQESIDYIFKKLISSGGTVADIGSGTGILSREFVNRGFETYCVEPNEKMRSAAERLLGKRENFHSVAAPAENTGLKSKSISLVTAASAFHWFDTEKFRIECNRILAEHGCVCLINNVRVYDDFTSRQHELCMKYGVEFTSLTHGYDMMKETVPRFFESGYTEEKFDFPLHYTKEDFISRSLSSSYAPHPETEEFEIYTAKLRGLLEEFFTDDVITIQNMTVLYAGMPARS